MKDVQYRLRRWILAAIVLAVLIIYVARLMKIQIIDAEEYQSLVNVGSTRSQIVKAVRGEIVDRSGQPLAVNRMGYDIIIDNAYFPSNRQEKNATLHRLMEQFERLGEEWDDNLPITLSRPFAFLDGEGYESAILRLKAAMGLQEYATVDNVMDALTAKYKLEDYSPEDARRLAGVFYEMERRDFTYENPYTFATDVDKESVIRLMERSYELPGVEVRESAVRVYENGTFAPHIIGSTGPLYTEEYQLLKEEGKIFQTNAEEFDQTGYSMDDTIGKDGIELAMEQYLRGKNGRKDIYIGAEGTVAVEETIPATPGNTVVLTLDTELQKAAGEALEAQIKFLNENAGARQGKEADVGAVVALDVKTGQVLAMASYPSYDLSTYRQEYGTLVQDPLSPLLNRAVNGVYTPGSIFKPTVAIAGMRAGEINATSIVNCARVYNYLNFPFTCMYAHGSLNVVRALTVSCNIFFYDVGRRIGIDAINETALELGLGDYTGIEISEKKGQLSIPSMKEEIQGEPWYAGDVLQASIGQMMNQFTPLQLANYAATIANRGTRMKTTLIYEIRDYNMNEVVQAFEPQVALEMDVEDWVFDTVIEGMTNASHTGTAVGYFGNYPIRIASKTGTPETSDLLNSTFIAFAPADDPEIAVAVVIEKGYHGYTGAPVAKAVFDTYFGIDINAPNNNGWDQLKARKRAEEQAAAQQAGPEEEQKDISPEDLEGTKQDAQDMEAEFEE